MGWIITVLLLYLAGMILIGVFSFKKSDSLSDYFIGGRRLNPWLRVSAFPCSVLWCSA
jgi:Na+/proline symporter